MIYIVLCLIITLQTYANCLLRDNLLVLLRSYIASVSSGLPNVRWQEVEGLLYILSNVTEDSLSAGKLYVITFCHIVIGTCDRLSHDVTKHCR